MPEACEKEQREALWARRSFAFVASATFSLTVASATGAASFLTSDEKRAVIAAQMETVRHVRECPCEPLASQG